MLVKPLSVGRVVPSCAGTKVNYNRKMSSEYSSKSQHNTTQHNREKTRTIHTANRNTTQRNTTGKRQEHNTANRNTTQRNTTGRTQHDKRQKCKGPSSWSIDQKLHGKIWSKNAAHLHPQGLLLIQNGGRRNPWPRLLNGCKNS